MANSNDKLIDKTLEIKRNLMIESVLFYGVDSPIVLRLSEEVDKLVYQHMIGKEIR